MEELDTVNSGLSTIRHIIPIFRSLLEKAPQEGASEEFTRQLNNAIIQMQQAVIDAQDMVLASQATETRLRSHIQDLEKHAARTQEWPKVISRYQLVDLRGNNGMTFALREEFIGVEEPMHYLCTNCSEDGIKSILQPTGMSIKPFTCPRCAR